MRKYIHFLNILFFLIVTHVHSQNFNWVKTFGSLRQDYISDITIDDNGFIYVLGTFSDTLYTNPVDPLFPMPNSLIHFNTDSNKIVDLGNGLSQVFFAKFSPQGNAIWVKNLGTQSSDFSYTIIVDKIGNIIISGSCFGNINLNPADTANQFVTSGSLACFLGKFDTNGNLIWKTLFSYIDIPLGIGEMPYVSYFSCSEIICISDNQLMIAGHVSGNFIVVHNEIAVDTIYPGSYKGLLMKVNENGLPVFENYLKIIGSNPFDLHISAASINSKDEVVIAGSFVDTLVIEEGNPSAILIQPDYAFGQRMFFAKFSSNGDFSWAKAIEGYAYTQANDIVFDAYDNMYITGFVGPQPNFIFTLPLTDFDPDTSTYEIPRYTFNTSEKSAFLASYSGNGNIRWAFWLYGADYDTFLGGEVEGKVLAIDYSGCVYMGGTTRCKILDVDPAQPVVPLTPGTNALNSPPNAFILRYTSDGAYLSQRIFYSHDGWAQINSMATDTNGFLYTAGHFTHGFQFNYTYSSTNTSLNSDTSYWWQPITQDMFLTQHSQCSNRTYTHHQICAGDSLQYNGFWLKHSGTFPRYISTTGNCDDIEILDLFVAPSPINSQTVNICAGETFNVGNQIFDQSGIYETILTSKNGCDSLIITQLHVDTLTALIALNDNIFSVITPPNGANFQWLNCDENYSLMAGAINPEFIPTADGNYAVEINSENCRDTSDCVSFSSVGISPTSSTDLQIYPNPSHGILHVEGDRSAVPFRIIDSQGRVVYAAIKNAPNTKLDLSAFPSGIYFFTTGEFTQSFTLIQP